MPPRRVGSFFKGLFPGPRGAGAEAEPMVNKAGSPGRGAEATNGEAGAWAVAVLG